MKQHYFKECPPHPKKSHFSLFLYALEAILALSTFSVRDIMIKSIHLMAYIGRTNIIIYIRLV